MSRAFIAVSIGAMLGALLRWWLGVQLNRILPNIPPGTLAANLIGAYIIGFGLALFNSVPAIPPEWRLLVVTGFCGGLTTFSTFSAELVTLLQQGQVLWCLMSIATHVTGSVTMTFLGIGTVTWLQRLGLLPGPG